MKSTKKIFTVTIGLSAFNEGKNISRLLNSILLQKEESFLITKILVISDGSTDDTAANVKKIRSKKIEFKLYPTRIGKSSRLNDIYRTISTDFLVQTDADVVFGSPDTIKRLINPLMKNNSIGMTAGRPIPLKGSTFTEKADSFFFKIYNKVYKNIKNGNIVYAADGRLLAYRKEAVKQIKIPHNMIANDVYTYYRVKELGYQFQYVPEAYVYFRSPKTLQDRIRQNVRAAAIPIRMKRYFSPELLSRESHVLFSTRIRSIYLQLSKDPIKGIYIFLISLYCAYKAKSAESRLTAKWPIAHTTKDLDKPLRII